MASKVSRRRPDSSGHPAQQLARENPKLQYRNVSITKLNHPHHLQNARLGLTWVDWWASNISKEEASKQSRGSERECMWESECRVPLLVGGD